MISEVDSDEGGGSSGNNLDAKTKMEEVIRFGRNSWRRGRRRGGNGLLLLGILARTDGYRI